MRDVRIKLGCNHLNLRPVSTGRIQSREAPGTPVAWSGVCGHWLPRPAQGSTGLQGRGLSGLPGCLRGVTGRGFWVASNGWGLSLGSAFALKVGSGLGWGAPPSSPWHPLFSLLPVSSSFLPHPFGVEPLPRELTSWWMSPSPRGCHGGTQEVGGTQSL